MCTDSYSVGELAGERAAKILKGGKPSSIPIESAKKNQCDSKHENNQKGQFQIPPDLGNTVTGTIR